MTLKGWTAAAALLLVAAPGVGHAVTDADFAARTTADLVALCEALDPDREPGRLTVISRMGTDRVEELL